MTKEQTAIQVSLEYLSDLCLEDDGEYKAYSDEDLLNAATIFNHVITAKTWEHKAKTLSHPDLEAFSIEVGGKLRKYILDVTGKDMHVVAEEVLGLHDKE